MQLSLQDRPIFPEIPSDVGLLEGCCCKSHPQADSITFCHAIHVCPPRTGWSILRLRGHSVFLMWQGEARRVVVQGPNMEIQGQTEKQTCFWNMSS